MIVQDALEQFLADRGVASDGGSGEFEYEKSWFYANISGRPVRVFPRFGFNRGLPAHDAHHMLNHYGTDWVGECETAAWELASGGCGWHGVYWVDRIVFFALGWLSAPYRTLGAGRRGWGRHNLYRVDRDQLLAMELDEAERRVGS